MKKNKIEVLKGKRGYWYWRIVWSNGKIACSSEMYSSMTKAKKSATKLYNAIDDTWELRIEE